MQPIDRLDRYFPQQRSDTTQRLARLIDAESPVGLWTRMCSLWLIGKTRIRELKTQLDPHLEARLTVIRETARWAHERL